MRESKNFGFIEVNDGTNFKNIQVVFAAEDIDDFDYIARQNVGAALKINGVLKSTPENKQPFEIMAQAIFVEGESPGDYPLQKKRHSLEFLRQNTHLRARTNTFSAVFRVRAEVSYAIHSFFHERGFIWVHTPIITASDAEGAGEMFKVTTFDFENVPKKDGGEVDFSKDFFTKPTNLTVSGQLEGETMAMAFKNIYTFGPTFRAENSNTARHAAEFWMIEPEMAFADLKDDMALAQDMIKYVIKYILKNCPQEMEFFNEFFDKGLVERLNLVANSDFGSVTYTEAIDILKQYEDDFEYRVFWGCDLQTEHERFLTERIFKKPVFVTDYPKEIKAFYMRLNDDDKTVAAMDLLVPGVGEIIGGSQREERRDVLLSRLTDAGLQEENYWWYLDLRRWGGARHAGFGLGFERLLMYLTAASNIRDVLLFPRTAGSAEF